MRSMSTMTEAGTSPTPPDGTPTHFAGEFPDPVVDYDLGAIARAAGPGGSAAALLDAMGQAGGFTAAKLAEARELLAVMYAGKEAAEAAGTTHLNWLSFPAALCATGTRRVFVEMVRQRKVNVISTTCGTLDHDLARSVQDYYRGRFELDDVALGEAGLNRLGNVIVPTSSHGEALEGLLRPWLEEIVAERVAGLDEPKAAWHGFGTTELAWALGDRIEDETSLLYWVAKHRVPIVVPAPFDGAVGAQLFMQRQRTSHFQIDLQADQQRLSDLVWDAEASHALIVGGGVSKHHVIWWNQYRDGLDSAVHITTAPEWDGSLSGARMREAISWGKLRPDGAHVTVEGDASVLLPLLAVDLLGAGAMA